MTYTTGPFTITSPTGSVPIVHNQNYHYGLNYSNYFKAIQSYCAQVYSFPYGQGTACGGLSPGIIACMTSSIQYEVQQTGATTSFQGVSWIQNYLISKTFIVPSLCQTQGDVDAAFAMGSVGRPPQFDNKVEIYKIAAKGSVDNVTVMLQAQYTGAQTTGGNSNANGNAYPAQLQALENKGNLGKVVMTPEGASLAKTSKSTTYSISKVLSSTDGILNHRPHKHSSFFSIMEHAAHKLSDVAKDYALRSLPPMVETFARTGIKTVEAMITGQNILNNATIHKIITSASHTALK
jgi:hypothetical protein